MKLFDSHAHLTDEWYEDVGGAAKVVSDAKAAGVERVCVVGTDIADSRAALELVRTLSGEVSLFASAGVHPHAAAKTPINALDELQSLLMANEVVALGEIGLDYHYDTDWKADQLRVFDAQLDLAAELRVPVIIHDREAHGDVLAALRARRGKVSGIVHCYSGSYEMAKECIDLGYYISFSGSLTFKNAARLKLAASRLPLDSLLIETDSPYLSPEPFRKERPNTPAKILNIAFCLSELKGIPSEEVAETTYMNACKAFDIAF